ncbi:MAG: hypothetical protein K6F39_02565 [Lachnospiraceae bacterium]|nr:hypothetical protein [Lachnospiraceae bacterium]
MRKRLLALSVVLALGLVGCAGRAAKAEKAESEAVSTETAESETEVSSSEVATEASTETVGDLGSSSEIDISGCKDFKQIIDERLENGMGYARANIGGIDVLLVASGCYDNMDGNMAAIDAGIYANGKDGVITYVGGVEAGGTAYPLAIKDGKLFVGGNHFMCKYVIVKGKLKAAVKAYEEFDNEGNATYFYDSEEEGIHGETDDDTLLPAMYDEYGQAEVINFTMIQK